MTIEEKNHIKEEYKNLKSLYNSLKLDIANVPSDSKENYEMRGEMTVIALEMQEIRRKLIDNAFGRFYPTKLLENFVFGEEEKERGGR